MPLVCKEQYKKTVSEDEIPRIDVSDGLRSGETVSSITSTTVTPSGELTATGTAASGSALEINGVSVLTAQAITFTASGGEAGTTYEVRILFVTSAGRTLQVKGIRITVIAD